MLIITGITLLTLVGVSGAGVDLGRQQLVRAKIQQASDAAVIATATLPDTVTDAQRIAAAERYFAINFPDGYMGVARPTPTVSLVGGVSVSATASMPSRFMGFVGVNTMTSTGRSSVAVRVTTSELDYDVVVVVDESGSTGAAAPGGGGSRMDVEKQALRDMVESVIPVTGPVNPNLRIGVVGYTGYISNTWGLTSNRDQALQAINSLRPIYHNYDHWGLEAGLKMINGDWSGSNGQITRPHGTVQQNTNVPAPRTPRGDGRSLSEVKHVVFLTDGFIMVEPPPCVNGAFVDGCQNYAAFLDRCTAIKNAGVTLYTISFASQTPGDRNTLERCASVDATGAPRYFFAPSSSVLKEVLGRVGETIRSIRITE